jgi:hypothetical protein
MTEEFHLSRFIWTILLAAIVTQLSGCANRGTELVTLVNVKLPVEDEIFGVVTVRGEEVDFDIEAVYRGGRTVTRSTAEIRGDTLFARHAGEPYEIALTDVSQIRIERADGLPTGLALLVGVAILTIPFW